MEGKEGKEKFKQRDGRAKRQMWLTSFPSEYHPSWNCSGKDWMCRGNRMLNLAGNTAL